MSRYAGATDPRDKLYALFNLARDREKLKDGGDGSVMHLEIDYTQPVKRVYVNAAKAMIASTGIQDVLQQAHSKHKSIPDLPTWVPDWSVSTMEDSVDKLRRFPKIQRWGAFYFPDPTEYVLEGIREDFSASQALSCDKIYISARTRLCGCQVFGSTKSKRYLRSTLVLRVKDQGFSA